MAVRASNNDSSAASSGTAGNWPTGWSRCVSTQAVLKSTAFNRKMPLTCTAITFVVFDKVDLYAKVAPLTEGGGTQCEKLF